MSRGQHTRNAGFQPGNHWVECQRCGFDIRESNTKKEWTGLIVCNECWEPRHTQDYVKSVKEDMAARGNVNPPPANVFTDRSGVTADGDDDTIPTSTF